MLTHKIIFFLLFTFLLFAEIDYKIEKHSDVISKENIHKLIGEQKEGVYIYYCPLRSYIYPNYTGLNDDELLEHFKGYLEKSKALKRPMNRILESYYKQKNIITVNKNEDKYDKKLKNRVILIAEFVNNHGKYRDPIDNVDSLGNAELYEFRVSEIIKDQYKFYKVEDKIMCYNPPYVEGGGYQKVTLLEKGQQVMLYMVKSYFADKQIFNKQPIKDNLKKVFLDPYATDVFDVIEEDSIKRPNLNYFIDLKILRSRNEELKSKKEDFYKIIFSKDHDKKNKKYQYNQQH